VEVQQGTGPTISAGLDFMDGEHHGQRLYIEDDGFPNLLLNALNATLDAGEGGVFARLLRRHLRRGLEEKNPQRQVMVWLGEGIDAADGRLVLKRGRLRPWRLQLEWDVSASKPVIDAILATQQRLSEVQGGRLRVPAYWRWLRSLVTVHPPLGGCAMAATPDQGVTDHTGQVFGYPGLYVADGALLPRPTGRNPSMTIAALAERVADLMTDHQGTSP
jgi:cholesterol oxidase